MSQSNAGRGKHAARKLTPEQRRRILQRRRQKQRRQRLIAVLSGVLTIVVVLCVVLLVRRNNRPDETGGGSLIATEGTTAESSETPEQQNPESENVSGIDAAVQADAEQTEFVFDDAYVAAVLGEDTGPVLTPDLSAVDPSKLNRWPQVSEGYIPVTREAENVTEKVIAITVDDCFQGENLRQIVQCALDNNGKLTIFPIGDNLRLSSVSSAVKWAWQQGMEIENHTFDHVGNYHYDDAGMREQIWSQNQLLDQVLEVDYQQHFFRPKGGDERMDQRTHAYVSQLGMYAIALWGASGTSNMETVIGNLKPGQVYLFHTTDKDMQKLLYFIPYVTQQGYRLVTLNELFGLPDNEVSALTPPRDAPALQSFHVIPAELRQTSYMRAAAVVQKRLIELGYLEGEPDGVFGESSYLATGYFQLSAGLNADGVAGPDTQSALFASDAPVATADIQAQIRSKTKQQG